MIVCIPVIAGVDVYGVVSGAGGNTLIAVSERYCVTTVSCYHGYVIIGKGKSGSSVVDRNSFDTCKCGNGG